MGNTGTKLGVISIQLCCRRSDISKPLQQQYPDYTSNKIALTEACQAIRQITENRSNGMLSNRLLSFDIQNLGQKQIKLCYLNLVILSSPDIPKGQIISINPLGFEFSFRDAKDGITYFGNHKRQKLQMNQKGELLNDVLLPKGKEKIPGRHFMVDYQWASNSYYIKDLGIGMGIFRKIHSPVHIRPNTMINLNGNFIVFDVIKHSQYTQLACTLYSKQTNGLILRFFSNEYNHRVVKIGRGAQCGVLLEDISVSKIQSTVVWRSGHWMLMDGDAVAKKYSRNGTWSKRVRWHDTTQFHQKCEQLSQKIDKALRPLTISEFQQPALSSFKASSVVDLQSLPQKTEEISRQKPRRQIQRRNHRLSWHDVISSNQVIKFLTNFFPDDNSILLQDFLNALEFEYPDLMDSDQIHQEVAEILSVDKETVSLNALELFTRGKGLEVSLQQIAYQVQDELKQTNKEMNQSIFNQLMDIKQMLDFKTSEINQKEYLMQSRQSQIEIQQQQLTTTIEHKINIYAQKVINKGKQELSAQMKRLKAMQRNVSEMLKLWKTRQLSHSQSLNRTKSKPLNEQTSAKLRSRILSLEKSNEYFKEKVAILETENKRDKETMTKLTQEVSRLKSRNLMLEQKTQVPPPPMKVEIKPAETPKVVQQKPSKVAEVKLLLQTLHTVFDCVRMTLPVYSQTKCRKNRTEDSQASLGQILFPSFNSLVPQIIEILPILKSYTNRQDTVCQILLQQIQGSILILFSILQQNDQASIISSQILLALTMQQFYTQNFTNQCSQIPTLISDCVKKSLNQNIRKSQTGQLQQNLIVLLQKLSSQPRLQPLLKNQQIESLAQQRLQTVESNEFFISNLNSIIRNLSQNSQINLKLMEDGPPSESKNSDLQSPSKASSRLAKWQDMISRWEYNTLRRKTFIKKRVRKGIPDRLRGQVWKLLLQIDQIQSKYQRNYYISLVENEDSPSVHSISLDLNRTFPQHVFFRQNGEGQQALYQVLKAYSNYDRELGYCQGMSYIMGLFLMNMSQEDSF